MNIRRSEKTPVSRAEVILLEKLPLDSYRQEVTTVDVKESTVIAVPYQFSRAEFQVILS